MVHALNLKKAPSKFTVPLLHVCIHVYLYCRKKSLLNMIQTKAPPVVKPLLKAKYSIIKMELEPIEIDGKVSLRHLNFLLHMFAMCSWLLMKITTFCCF